MADLIAPGDAVEGSGLHGQSRDPINSRGLRKEGGNRVFVFVARFNVEASVSSPPPSNKPRLTPSASTSPEDILRCDKALILSVKRKYSEEVGPGSATHQARKWKFPAQSSAIIEMDHQEIANARYKAQVEAARELTE